MRLPGGAPVALSSQVEPPPPIRSRADWPAVTPESTALAAELRRRGFRFVGPTTAYATMQAAGLVNDHAEGCVVRDEVETQQRAAAARFTRR